MNRQPTFEPQRLFFLDETNVNTRMHRLYGRGPMGERVVDSIPYRHYESTTLLSVIGIEGPVASFVYEGGTDVLALETFIEGLLSNELRPGDVLVMDNLASHKSATIQHLLQEPSRPANRVLQAVLCCSGIIHPGGQGHGTTGQTRSQQRTVLAADFAALAAMWADDGPRILCRAWLVRAVVLFLATHPC
jgi:DDE superfamily endonuclease